MRCSSVLRQLDELACGELRPDVAEAVQAHLSGCFPCTRAYAESVEARNALASLRPGGAALGEETPCESMEIPGVDDEFFRVMREEIVAEVASKAREPVTVTRKHFWFGSGFAAAAVLLFAIGFLLGMFPRTGEIWNHPTRARDEDGLRGPTITSAGMNSGEAPVSEEGGLRPLDDVAVPMYPLRGRPIFLQFGNPDTLRLEPFPEQGTEPVKTIGDRRHDIR